MIAGYAGFKTKKSLHLLVKRTKSKSQMRASISGSFRLNVVRTFSMLKMLACPAACTPLVLGGCCRCGFLSFASVYSRLCPTVRVYILQLCLFCVIAAPLRLCRVRRRRVAPASQHRTHTLTHTRFATAACLLHVEWRPLPKVFNRTSHNVCTAHCIQCHCVNTACVLRSVHRCACTY